MGATLEALVARLERVTAFLENTVGTVGSGDANNAGKLDTSVVSKGLTASVTNLDSLSHKTSEGNPESVSAFDELLQTKVRRVSELAEKIGGPIVLSCQILRTAFEVERKIVLAISQCKCPDIGNLQKLIEPLGEAISKAHTLAEGKRTDAFNHQKVVAESLRALSWVVYSGKDCGLSLPGAHVEESWQSAEFYNNKVLVEFRNKDINHVDWAKAVKDLYVPSLRDYVLKFHRSGPAWSENGVDVSQFSSDDQSIAAPTRLPPPPPCAPHRPSTASASNATPVLSMSSVFQEINKGEGVTRALRKVTDDMKTKNQADRIGSVPAGHEVTTTSEKGAAKDAVKPPKFELQMGRKWVVENQVGNRNLIIDDCHARQSVYIFGCKNCVVQVKGKVNNITVDKSIKTGIVFSDVVAAFEVVNCTSVEVQCQGTAPTIAVDNTNGCQLYMSKDSLNASITTAKSSEVNVLLPGATEDADLVEHALPEQFLNIYENGQFVTTPVSHSGG